MYDAWEAPTHQRVLALAKKALSISSDCADAYNFLVEQAAKSVEEAIDLFLSSLSSEICGRQNSFSMVAGWRDLLKQLVCCVYKPYFAIRTEGKINSSF
jgi:hypothetical protein